MIKGGYQIIDLGGFNFTSSNNTKIEGIYDKIGGTTKPTLISGLVYEGVEYRDVYATFIASSGG